MVTNFDRGQIDQRVRESPDLLAGIIGSAMDAIIAIDDAQRIVVFNSAAERIFVCTAHEAIGNSIERFIPERFRAEHSTHVRRFAESGVTNRALGGLGTLWGLRANGEEFPIEASISKVESGGRKFFAVVVRDITEHHRAEEAVRESEQRFRLVADTAPVLLWMSGTDKLCTYFNKPWLDFTGRAMEEELGNGWAEGVHPDDLQECLQTYTQFFDRREKFKMEYRLRRHDGEYRWIFDIGVPRFNHDGSFAGYIGTCIDITDRKLAEQTLRESEERLRLAQRAARIGTFEWNIQTDVNTWTPELQAMYGLTPGDFGGTHAAFEELVYVDDRPRLRELVEATLSTGQPTKGEWRVVWPDGSIHWLAARWQVLKDKSGKPSRVVGVNIDITERKLAEKTFHESEERLRLALQAGKMYAYEWDVATDLIVRSGDIASVLGSTGEPPLTRRQLLTIIHPDDRAIFNASVTERTPENPGVQISYRLLRPDGSVIWLEKTAHAFFDEQGRMLRMIGMMADITDHKLAEEALSDVNRRLIQAQEQERTRIARDLHDDVSQRLALLAIKLEQLPLEVQSRAQELHKEVVEISNNVQSLSHDLHSSQLEYLGVVAGMRSWCREFGERHGIQIDFRHDVRSILSREVGLCLFRVLQEALNNAVKHSGGKRIKAQLHEEAGDIHLIVSDSGRGFDMKQALAGKGLGLTSMRERVRLVNGTITIDSKPMHGTTIHVRVPIESEQSQQLAV